MFEAATPTDTPAILALLVQAGLPTEEAPTHQLSAVYLLTTTAERFFPRFGFEQITRADVPATVQESVEFKSACPASAIVMRKHLRGPATENR